MKWRLVERAWFNTELEAETWMVNNCLENGCYRFFDGQWVVYEDVLGP